MKRTLALAKPRRSPRLIFISSAITGSIGFPFQSAICASHHAVESIADSLRREVKSQGIDVVCLRPGIADRSFRKEWGEKSSKVTITGYFFNSSFVIVPNPFPWTTLFVVFFAPLLIYHVARQMLEAWDCSTPWTRQRSSGQPLNPNPPLQHFAMRPMTPSPKTSPRHVSVSAAAVSRTRLSVGLFLVPLSTGRSRASPSRFTLLPPSRSQIPPPRSMKSNVSSCGVHASYFSSK